MRSDTQLDLYRDDPKRLAAANREAAATALLNPFFTAREREQRHAHYLEQAQRYEEATPC